jgi:CheY-like chemotaxis protein
MARILLVEDEMLVRELAFEDLSDAGYDVVAANDGDEALAILRHDVTFDLLFTDIKMPSAIDGRELAVEAKRVMPGLKVIYASGLADIGQAGAGERYLPKPYRRETLLKLLEDLGITA